MPGAIVAPVTPKVEAPVVIEKKEKPKREKVKCDPKLIQAARELRDRWMEEVQSGRLVIESAGKYEVARMIECAERGQIRAERPLGLPPVELGAAA